jgi:hypothetical protein
MEFGYENPAEPMLHWKRSFHKLVSSIGVRFIEWGYIRNMVGSAPGTIDSLIVQL